MRCINAAALTTGPGTFPGGTMKPNVGRLLQPLLQVCLQGGPVGEVEGSGSV